MTGEGFAFFRWRYWYDVVKGCPCDNSGWECESCRWYWQRLHRTHEYSWGLA